MCILLLGYCQQIPRRRCKDSSGIAFGHFGEGIVTEPAIVDSLVLALELNTTCQLIILMNMKADIPGYTDVFGIPIVQFQIRLIKTLQEKLSKIGALERLGIFTLWTHEKTVTSSGPIIDRIIRTFVHAKAAVIDGLWATIGSANLDGTSLNRATHVRVTV